MNSTINEKKIDRTHLPNENDNSFPYLKKDTLKKTIGFFLENFQCSYCHEYQNINQTDNKNNKEEELILETKLNSWNLYLKEFDNYSALILYHPYYKKDIIEIIKNIYKNSSFDLVLYDNNNEKLKNRFITLEFVSKNEEEGTSIWVPCDADYKLYERIIEDKKVFDEKMNAYIIGTYDIEVKK